ncbi:MAG: biotin/lipoate A/B protein ligase family protein [Gemmatimonadota bacterium]
MKTDEALLEEVLRSGRAFLRLYRWDPATLSIGRNQHVVYEGVPVVRRPTGGAAVWHDDEVTYAVAAPIAIFGSLRRAYREIHARLASALRTLGVDARLADAPAVRPSDRPAACFAAPAGGEILVGGRKLVGSAQVRKRDAFLQHGSVLLDGSQEIVSNAGGETTLAEILGRQVTFDEVSNAIIAHWPSGRQAVRPSDIASVAAG